MENCRFNNNQSADFYVSQNEIDPHSIDSNDGRLVSIINSNFENNQSDIAVIDNHTCPDSDEITQNDCEKLVTLKNNYYGNSFGPYLVKQGYDYYLEHEDWYDEFVGKIIGENASYPDFRKKSLIADPAIILPGITGSAMSTKTGFLGELELDPILHTYDDLRESMMDNGYEKNINLFEFPYEWRNSNEISAQNLKEKIQEIQSDTLMSRVDLVAHSMGGLVARKYIQGSDYEWNIDQFITLGTPHRGSPKSYLQWEAAEGFFGREGLLMKHHFQMEALHSGYLSLFEYIRDKVSSVGELLPDYDYLEEDGEMRSYPENYPRNVFLEDLNSNNLDRLDQIRFLNIVGKIDNEVTINRIKVTDESDEDKWENGKPENFDNNYRDGLIGGNGDETVPLESSEGIDKGILREIDSTHGDLPTKAQCEVFHELTGDQVCIYKNEWDIPNIFLFNVLSPVDIQIIAPDGKRVGKDFETGEIINEIDGAYYTGFDTENEVVTIPNPQDGKYQIKTQGTGEGNFKIETAFIKENDESLEGTDETVVSFEGEAQIGTIEENSVNLKDGEVTQEEPDITPPTITINSPENQEYFNNQELRIDYEVSDDISEPEKIATGLKLDNEMFTEEKIKFPLMNLGEHNFQIIAKDESENQSQSQIDFTLKTDLDSLIKNTDYYYRNNLITNRGIKRVIQNHLEQTQKLIDYKNKIISCYKFHSRQIRLLENIFNKIIERRIELIIKYIHWGEKRGFIEDVTSERLTEGLKYIKNNKLY